MFRRLRAWFHRKQRGESDVQLALKDAIGEPERAKYPGPLYEHGKAAHGYQSSFITRSPLPIDPNETVDELPRIPTTTAESEGEESGTGDASARRETPAESDTVEGPTPSPSSDQKIPRSGAARMQWRRARSRSHEES